MEAPTASGESRSRLARTGAPACASTALMPSVRSMVLLPDMLEPLTTSTRGPPVAADTHVVAHHAVLGKQRMADRLGLQTAAPRRRISGNGSAGCSKAWLASEQSASISPAAVSQRRTAGPECRRQSSTASAWCGRPQNEDFENAHEDVVARIQVFHRCGSAAPGAATAARPRRPATPAGAPAWAIETAPAPGAPALRRAGPVRVRPPPRLHHGARSADACGTETSPLTTSDQQKDIARTACAAVRKAARRRPRRGPRPTAPRSPARRWP